MKSIFRKSITAIAVSASLGLALPAVASDVIGTVNNINDNSSYTVKVKNPATGLERTLSISSEGTFRFASLPTGSYEIQILKGDAVVAEDRVRVSLGANSKANFDLNSFDSSGPEVIQVVGARISSIDLSTADSGLVITDAEIDRMPINRDLTSVALLAPGAVKGDSAFGNTASFGGSSVAENACYINGLEVTNTRQGLGCGEVPFEFYDQFQVKTGGYSAKFGRATGGTINTTTKGGTNEWEFSAVVQYQPDSLQEEGSISRGNNGAGQIFRDESYDSDNKTDVTLAVGGPLIEDTLFLWFNKPA